MQATIMPSPAAFGDQFRSSCPGCSTTASETDPGHCTHSSVAIVAAGSSSVRRGFVPQMRVVLTCELAVVGLRDAIDRPLLLFGLPQSPVLPLAMYLKPKNPPKAHVSFYNARTTHSICDFSVWASQGVKTDRVHNDDDPPPPSFPPVPFPHFRIA